MRYRRLGKTGRQVSEVGFGAWAIGGDWGEVDERDAMAALHAAVDAGVTFFDTADVYGDGRSERLLARLRRERDETLLIATKLGRRGPQQLESFTREAMAAWLDRSRDNLGVERIDLVQLHCPPPQVHDTPQVFADLDAQVAAGRVAAYGVSVERVEEALTALRYDGVATVQIIFNCFRQRPAEQFLDAAAARDVGVIARVPLASGLLTGKLGPTTTFDASDHRSFNRQGEAFDVGETFAGVDYDAGLRAVEELRPLVPEGASMAQMALRWILDHPQVSTVIPGAKNPEQARANAAASDLAPLPRPTHDAIRDVYRRHLAPLVHDRW